MNPLYFFAVWDSMMAAVTKNSAEHENDNISITQKFGAKEEALRTPPPPPPVVPPPSPSKKIRFGFFLKIHLLEKSKYEL